MSSINVKKFQKKVLKLIQAIKKCDLNDLQLFCALCLIRFENEDIKKYGKKLCVDMDVSTTFSQVCDIATELNKDNNIHYLLN